MDLMNDKDAAKYLGLSVATLRAWRYRQAAGQDQGEDYPPYCKLGAAVRYKRTDLDDWVNRNIVGAA